MYEVAKLWVYVGSSKSSSLPGAQAVTKGVMKRKGRRMWEWSVYIPKRRLELRLQGWGATEDFGLRREGGWLEMFPTIRM